MKEKMSKAGYDQGDMKPHVEDYQLPRSAYSQEGFSKTTEYVERQDKFKEKQANSLRKQDYKGRYS